MPTKSKTKISIVIPAYNEEAVIAKTLATIYNQNYKNKFELIVCDNNSTDKTAEIAARMGAKVVSERRKGTMYAYDAGMRAATGDLILVTNADVLLPYNWISSIVKCYEDPSVVGVGTKVKFYDVPRWINWVLFGLDRLNPQKSMWGTSLSCRRWVYEKVGGFNHGTNLNEDAVFSLLIKKHGKIRITSECTVLMDGRRFRGGPIRAFLEWWRGYGLNSVYILINYIFFKRIKSRKTEFKDIREEPTES